VIKLSFRGAAQRRTRNPYSRGLCLWIPGSADWRPRNDKVRPLIVRLALLLVIAIVVAGCGKKGAPQPPPDEPNTFPRSYPNV
jgi:predicted small lipoprotein YifL